MRTDFLSENDSALLLIFRTVLAVLITYNFASGSISGYLIPANLQYSLLILLHPYLLRFFNVELTARQIIWISVGLFLHPLGMIYGLYLMDIQWDALTHLYGGSILAGAILTFLWSFDRDKIETLFAGAILMLGFSVCWEMFEYFIADHLTVYGWHDTVTDIIYNFVGFSLVWIFGRERLSNVVSGFRSFRK